MSIEKIRYIRLRSGILYTLNKLSENGHCYAEREQLIETAVKLLEVDSPELEFTLDDMIHTADVIKEDDAIYLLPFYFAETGCAKRLQKLMTSERNTKLPVDQVMERVQKNSKITFDEVQLEAIRQAVSSKVMTLTGGPGTGKTTTTLGIISTYRMAGCRIILAAPTGRAAKRMSEATGMEAKTIHRLLEYNPADGYQRNPDNPLEADVLIVDECSMIDIMLSCFRQAQGSRIIMNAHRINHGEMPDLRGGRNSDFFFAAQETNEATADLLVKYCTQNLPRYYHADAFRDIQVLTPMQRGVCGAANLNQLLQEAMNPSNIFLKRGGTQYRLHDKVMQIRNDYDKEVTLRLSLGSHHQPHLLYSLLAESERADFGGFDCNHFSGAL